MQLQVQAQMPTVNLCASSVCIRFNLLKQWTQVFGLIVVITEGVPTLDMLKAKRYLETNGNGTRLIGSNCSRVLLLQVNVQIGIMPVIFTNRVKLVLSLRSGTLTYEAVAQTTKLGLGQSTCIGYWW